MDIFNSKAKTATLSDQLTVKVVKLTFTLQRLKQKSHKYLQLKVKVLERAATIKTKPLTLSIKNHHCDGLEHTLLQPLHALATEISQAKGQQNAETEKMKLKLDTLR